MLKIKSKNGALPQKELLIFSACLFFLIFIIGIRLYMQKKKIIDNSKESAFDSSISSERKKSKTDSAFSDENLKKNAKILDQRLEDHESTFKEMIKNKGVREKLFGSMPE